MKIKKLIKGTKCRLLNPEDLDVSSLSYDSRKVQSGALFAALKGVNVEGSRFAHDAVRGGAVCVLSESADDTLGVMQVIVPDARRALALISERFYGNPAQKLRMAGITGTNGKTTSAYIAESIFVEAGLKTGVIGTVNYRYDDRVFEAPHTTPEAPELSAMLREMRGAGVTECVMEVSSHALSQSRVGGCRFDGAIFTNLTHEHLDYHHTMEDYFKAKSELFTELMREDGSASIINIDDKWGVRLATSVNSSLTFSMNKGSGADIYPESVSFTVEGTKATLMLMGERVEIESPLVGDYNLLNIMGAAGLARSFGLGSGTIARGINNLDAVPGRLEEVKNPEGKALFSAYVDYAHTADALERAITALKKLTSGRLITVFGCGGERDREKRPAMGKISAALSGLTIITTDNPRGEDALSIIKEIEEGMGSTHKLSGIDEAVEAVSGGYLVVADRLQAIRAAVGIAGAGDVILLAGKGHEDYQLVGGKTLYFDDRKTLAEEMDLAVKQEGC